MLSLIIRLYVTKKEIKKAIKKSYFTIIVNLKFLREEERLESSKANVVLLLSTNNL
jgi:hypothetical protein